MPIEIRKARPEELEEIQQISHRTISASYPPFLGEGPVETFLASGEDKTYLATNLSECWVLLDGGALRGFAVCKENKVDLMMVATGHHRRGYGSALLLHCEEQLRPTCDEIIVESFAANQKANAFYQKHGWRERDRRPDPASGGDMLILVKPVDPAPASRHGTEMPVGE